MFSVLVLPDFAVVRAAAAAGTPWVPVRERATVCAVGVCAARGRCDAQQETAAQHSSATQQRSHLAADTWAARYMPRTRAAIERIGHALAVLPFALFVLFVPVSGALVVWNWRRSFQSFRDTFNPGYFIVKCAASSDAMF